MNELAICNENSEIVQLVSESGKVANEFFEMISKKGSRDFLTDLAKLNTTIKIQKIAAREAEMKERYEYDKAKLQSHTMIRLAEIDLNKTAITEETKIDIEREKTEQLRISEQSKCLQKIVDTVKDAYDNKMDFFKVAAEQCTDYYKSQISGLDTAIQSLTTQKKSLLSANFSQQTYIETQRQLQALKDMRRDTNSSYERINLELITAVNSTKLVIPESLQLTK